MHERTRLLAGTLATAFLIFGAGVPAADAATPITLVCGGTVGPGGSFVADGDLAGCDSSTNPALTVVGPVTLDLAGHRVACQAGDPPVVGMRLQGTSAKVRKGNVVDCSGGFGVDVSGGGKHSLQDVAVSHNVVLQSDRNQIARSSISTITVSGDSNKIRDSVAFQIEITGAGNLVKSSSALLGGVQVDGNDNNLIKNESTAATLAPGFEVNGNGNKLTKNVANANGTHGIEVNGNENKLTRNTTVFNSTDGINVAAATLDNKLVGNRTMQNTGNGIELGQTGSPGNRVVANIALGNGNADLRDDDGTCSAGFSQSTWTNNTFSSSDPAPPSCIQ